MTAAAWTERRERGSAALIRLMIWLTLGLGWPVGQALLYPITGYFFLFSRGVRKALPASSSARVLGRPATRRDVFRHLFTFSCVLLDRLFLLSNRLRHFQIEVTGLDHVTSALAEGGDASCSVPISAASRCCAPSPGDRRCPSRS